MFKDIFFPLVSCFSGNKLKPGLWNEWFTVVSTLPKRQLLLGAVSCTGVVSLGKLWSEEVNWLEWNLCGGEELATELAMAYIRIETREVIWCWGWVLEPEITFRPEESTRQQLPAGASAYNITKLRDLWFLFLFLPLWLSQVFDVNEFEYLG